MQQQLFLSTAISWILFCCVVGQVDQACDLPIGMQSKRIPDYYLTASTSHAVSTGPAYARLTRNERGGAWCPKNNVEPKSENEYLQVQLPATYLVKKIATQGRYDNGNGNEFTRMYKVKYSRDGKHWITWSNINGVEILSGNIDTQSIVEQSFNPRIAGVKYIRIVPLTTVSSPVCIRLELYGCKWNSGLLSYSITAPDQTSFFDNRLALLSDDTFDGYESSLMFKEGLGQLVDGKLGDDIYLTMSSSPESQSFGFDYVGWTVSSAKQVEMLFHFDKIRKFTFLRIHSYVDKAISASLFSLLRISFSTNAGVSFSSEDTNKPNMESSEKRLQSFTVSLSPERLANAIRCRFNVPQGRLLISEVEFNNKVISSVSQYTDKPGRKDVPVDDADNAVVTQVPPDDVASGDSTGVIVGILVGVIVLLVIVVAALFYRQRKLRETMTPPSYLFKQPSNRDEPFVTLAPRLEQPPKPDPKMPIYHEIADPVNLSENVYHEPKDAVCNITSSSYQSSQEKDGSARLLSSSQLQTNNDVSAPHYAETDVYAPNLFEQPIQGVSGNNIYAVPWSSPSLKKIKRKKKLKKSTIGSNKGLDERKTLLGHIHADELPPEFPRKKLVFIEKLGEGQFGEVHLCKADPLIRTLEDDEEFILPGSPTSPVLVAVKILREDASTNAKEDFIKEVRVMSRLLHPNIVRLLAVCTEDEPLAMVTEYMEHGDLNQYLQDFDDEMKPVPGKRIIGLDSLIKIAVQVASGMEYLSSLNFIHRDLAARNCLVGPNDEIRIGDFGMSRNMYQSDYYRIQGRAVLPIRWMAWECVLLGKFSSASDIWAFGVTLWEIYALCRHQPFSNLSDKEVIDNMNHLFNKSGKEIHLPRPKRCPATTYNMIRQCWKREPKDRPTFDQLHSFLRERRHTTSRASSKPKRPQVKPPVPLV